MENYMWIVWLSIFVLSLIIEAIGTDLISIWFGFGAVVALVISFIPGVNWWIELIVFLVISIATLLCFRPLVNKFLKRSLVKSNVDQIIGKKAELSEAITPLKHGELKINDMSWSAVSSDEKASIEKDSLVVVVAIEGNKLVVKPLPKEDNDKQLPKGGK